MGKSIFIRAGALACAGIKGGCIMNETNERDSDGRLRIVGGLLLIALGVVLLITNNFYLPMMSSFWPFIIIAVGIAFFVAMVVRGPAGGGLAIPGSILTLLGIILLVQSLTGNWINMTFVWPLFVFGGIGIGLLIDSWWADRMDLKRAGYTMLMLALIFFVAFGTFFSALFGENNSVTVFAVMLIVAGVLALVLRLTNTSGLIERLPPYHGHHALHS
jgi:drug/metabolite transporter (DMT)-like permease